MNRLTLGDWLYAGFISFGLGFLVGVNSSTEGVLRSQAVARNVARYHPVTGKWEWTVEPKGEPK